LATPLLMSEVGKMTIDYLIPLHKPSTHHVGDIVYLKKSVGPTGYTYFLYGTLQHPATCPLKAHSMAVRAIPLPVCHHGLPNGYRTGFKRCSDAQQFIQLTVVDDINAKAVEA
jgi:hypothetical protein